MIPAQRAVWNVACLTWQTLITRTPQRAGRPRARRLLATAAALAVGGSAAWAQGTATLSAPLPSGGQVSAGSGSIHQQGQQLTVRQTSQRMVADWRSFDIGAGHTVQFQQPSASAVVLNRVLGNDPSVIQGALRANGQVFLLNPNGVLFTPTAQVQVGGLLASTLALSNDDFLAGRTMLNGNSHASVANAGHIRAADGGSVALVAARVLNSGQIQANGGQVLLGAGSRVTLDLGGPVPLRVEQAALDALISQGGAVRADGGVVVLSAKAAADLGSTVIAHNGITEARSLATGPGGRIMLEADSGIVQLTGRLDVQATAGRGGHLSATAPRVLVDDGATLDASGALGGGLLQVGGGWQGRDSSLANAQEVLVRAGATLQADALRQGDGGTVVVWADGGTQFAGRISATGGPRGGNGGQVEVSGKQHLGFTGHADTSAPSGLPGLLLLDPSTLTITDGSSGQTGTYANWSNQAQGGSYTIPETVLEGMTGNVVLTAVTDIIINNLSDNLLNLSATNISFFANDESSGSSTGGFTMRDINDTIRLNQGAGSSIVFQGGNVSSRNTTANSNAAFTSASIFIGNVETLGASVVLNTKRSSAATPMVVNGTITTNGGSVSVAPGTRFGLTNSNAVDLDLRGAVDTGGGDFTSNMTGTVQVNGGMNLGAGSATFGGTGTQINSLLQSTSNISVNAPLSFGANAGISTSGTVTFNSTASMLAGGSLTLTASDFVFNNSFNGNAANITLRPYSAATDVDIGSAGSGGMLISAAALAQLSGFGNITIGRSDGTGTTTVVSDTSVAASGVFELVNRRIDVTGGRLGNTTGTVRLTGDQINIGRDVTATSGISLQALDPTATLQMAFSNGATLDTSLLTLGSASGGPLVLQSDVPTTAGTAVLRSAGSITAIAGGVAVADLAVDAGGAVDLSDSSFNFTTLALNAGGDSLARSSQAFAVGTVAGLSGATVTGHRLSLQTTGSGSVTASQAISADSLELLGSLASFNLLGATHSVGSLAADVGGALALHNADGLAVDLVGSTTGVQAGGAVDLATLSGNLQIAQAVVTTAQGDDAIRLTAGRSSSAGTASGGDVLLGAQGSLQTGSGGRTTVYTGSLAGASSLVALAGSGSGRFRYHSDESSTGYSTSLAPLGSGVQVVFREQPVLTVTPDSATTTYGDAPPAASVQLTGQRFGDGNGHVSGSATVLNGGALSGAGHTVAGTHDRSYSGGLASSLGYGFQDDASSLNEWTVQARSLALGGLVVASRPYDGGLQATLTGTAAVSALGGDSVSVSGTAVASFNSPGAGTARPVSISGLGLGGADAGNYQLDSALTGTITPRPITVTANAQSKVYGSSDPTLTYQLTSGSLVGNDSLSGSLSRNSGENVGSYAISAAALANGNYTITAVDGALSITPRPITVAADAQSKVYGNSDPALTYRLTTGSLVGNDSLSGSLSRTTGENVGSYTISAAALANGNYTITAVDGALSITPRAITVTADAKSKVYGNGDPTLTYQLTAGSLVGNDSLSGSLSRTTGENVGSYTISAAALANGNYTITAIDGALSITPRPITVTADAKSKVYGNSDPALTYQLTTGSLVGNDSLSGSLSRTTGENVGSYTISASALANGNYTVTAIDGALSITPRPITVTADAKSKVYGNDDPTLTYQLTAGSLVGNDSLSGSLSRSSGENVGGYTISAAALVNGNYTITAIDGALSITPRAITVTADAKSKVYGNSDPALTYRLTTGSLVGNDSLSGSLSRSSGENVGSYTISAAALANGNYTITAVDGALSITPRPITVAAEAQSKVYGNSDPALTYRLTTGSLVGNDSLSGSLSRSSGENVGSYTISAASLANGNYTITAVDGALSITPRAITVAADAQSKVYGNSDPALTYRLTTGSLVGNDSLSGSLSRSSGENVGGYTISAAALANGNYTITAIDGALSITPRPITVSADAKTKVYGNSDPALTYQLTAGSLVGTDSLSGSLSRTTGENVGSHTISAAALTNGNYTITAVDGSLSITPRPITVTADAKSKVYGNSDPALTYQLTNGSLVGSDSLGGSLSRSNGENVGSYTISAAALANGNYTVTTVDGVLRIMPAVLVNTVSGNAPTATMQTPAVVAPPLPTSGGTASAGTGLVLTPLAPGSAAMAGNGGAGNSAAPGRLFVVDGGLRGLAGSVPGTDGTATDRPLQTPARPVQMP
ncbi:MBG domain-containing protein [Pseudaquabacterium pictum]|uniref:Filamentous haemagglutinin FhaB/tRNA nuclease CdiA-like TPS domain-containing protein n=1 Tax=Pseudaquabacterium pictum TaxID=2315236 RepID=A0A480AMM7_9BURK|nr:MBG domain-containing protein [Rubrivivax pictus]GCL62751.1 hypothetical protein AQPW35_18320 [Rubrivivax pictus]